MGPPPGRAAFADHAEGYAEGLRVIYLYTAAHQDPVVAAAVSGADEDVAKRVNALLLPIIKGVGSERAYKYLTESLQTLAVRVSYRTIPPSSTSATPRSTRCMSAPRQSRRRTSSSDRWRVTRASR
jgi:hypothetical protein